jgi:hypothetical protein
MSRRLVEAFGGEPSAHARAVEAEVERLAEAFAREQESALRAEADRLGLTEADLLSGRWVARFEAGTLAFLGLSPRESLAFVDGVDGAGLVVCPECGAAPGAQCSREDGTEVASLVHAARSDLAEHGPDEATRETIEGLRYAAGFVAQATRALFSLFPELNLDGPSVVGEDDLGRIPREVLSMRSALTEAESYIGFAIEELEGRRMRK